MVKHNRRSTYTWKEKFAKDFSLRRQLTETIAIKLGCPLESTALDFMSLS